MTVPSSQYYEAFVPVYDVCPEKWEEAREFIVEQLKKIANAVNIRDIGWLADEEILSGKQMYPGTANTQLFRTVFRLVINSGALVNGLNTIPHGLNITAGFTLIDLWAAASNSITLVGTPINGTGNIAAARTGLDINYDATNVYILSNGTYDRSNIFFEYMEQL